MEFVPLLAMGALVGKFIDFLKYLRARDWNGASTILIAWAAGLGATFLVASTSFAAGVDIGAGKMLADLTAPDKAFFGMMASSIFGFAYDVKKSLDNTDSAKTPTLLPE
jgi:hypothetical protein